MKNNFETMMDIVDEVEHIKEKIALLWAKSLQRVAIISEDGGATEEG